MTTALQVAAAKIPGYCASGHGVLSPAQWAACVKAGWQEPTTTAGHLGFAAGHNVGPFLIGLLIVVAVLALARRGGSRTPAASKS